MQTKEKELILECLEIVKEYVEGNFRTINFFIDLEVWDVLALFFCDTYVENLLYAYSYLSNLLELEKEDN